MVESLAQLLALLHGAGYAHRDLKPANALYLMHDSKWRLLDLGVAKPIGARCIVNAHRCALHCHDCKKQHLRLACISSVPGANVAQGWQDKQGFEAFAPCKCQVSAAAVEHVKFAGDLDYPRFTLTYAPPEIVQVVHSHISKVVVHGSKVVVHGSADIWALGVLAFETITAQTSICTARDKAQRYAQVTAMAAGAARYPWEVPAEEQPPVWQTSRLRGVIAPCLNRDPDARPTAEQVWLPDDAPMCSCRTS